MARGDELITGNTLANVLAGDPGDVAGGHDQIEAGAGNDTIYGGGGTDVLYGQDDNDLIFGDFDPSTPDGGNFAPGDDYMSGGNGNDTMVGGFGVNFLDGGANFDTADYSSFFDDFGNYTYRIVALNTFGNRYTTVIAHEIATGIETTAATDILVGIEAITGTAGDDVIAANDVFSPAEFAGNTLTGGGGNDTLNGGIGTDVLYGGDGNDTLWDGGNLQATGGDQMNGGFGNDIYSVSSARTRFFETALGGFDEIQASVSFTLPPSFERLVLVTSNVSTAISGVGNTLNNQIVGNHFSNFLSGLGGNDLMQGGIGNDNLFGSLGADSLYGGEGNDSLNASNGNDQLYGENGNDYLNAGSEYDQLFGGWQNDTLLGGTGRDTLTGGNGSDQFLFLAASETAVGSLRDVITDFRSVVDRINLRALATGQHFIGAAAFANNGTAQVRYDKVTGILSGDLTGNGVVDWEIGLTAGTILAVTDLYL